jgi:uncharacterized membrane protein YbhN (UPF0104 family)
MDWKQKTAATLKSWSKSRYFAIGKWVFLMGLLILAVRLVNVSDIKAGFERISFKNFLLYILLLLLSKLIYAFRWRYICTDSLGLKEVRSLFLLRVNLLAEFVSIAMPSNLTGEAVRILKVSARAGKPAKVAAAIAADRLLGVSGMAFIVLLLLPQLGILAAAGKLPPWLKAIPLGWAILATGLTAAVILSGVLVWLRRRGGVEKVKRILIRVRRDLSVFVLAFLLTVLGHLIFAAGHYFLFLDIQAFPLLTVISIVLTSQLARSVPLSIMGVGLSEGSLVALESLIGMRSGPALAVVVGIMGARYIFAAIGLLIELCYDGKTFLNTAIRQPDAVIITIEDDPGLQQKQE